MLGEDVATGSVVTAVGASEGSGVLHFDFEVSGCEDTVLGAVVVTADRAPEGTGVSIVR